MTVCFVVQPVILAERLVSYTLGPLEQLTGIPAKNQAVRIFWFFDNEQSRNSYEESLSSTSPPNFFSCSDDDLLSAAEHADDYVHVHRLPSPGSPASSLHLQGLRNMENTFKTKQTVPVLLHGQLDSDDSSLLRMHLLRHDSHLSKHGERH